MPSKRTVINEEAPDAVPINDDSSENCAEPESVAKAVKNNEKSKHAELKVFVDITKLRKIPVNRQIIEGSSSEEELVKDNPEDNNTDTEDDEKDKEEVIDKQDNVGHNDEEKAQSDHEDESLDNASLTDNNSAQSKGMDL